jgi:hypothetical protein
VTAGAGLASDAADPSVGTSTHASTAAVDVPTRRSPDRAVTLGAGGERSCWSVTTVKRPSDPRDGRIVCRQLPVVDE